MRSLLFVSLLTFSAAAFAQDEASQIVDHALEARIATNLRCVHHESIEATKHAFAASLATYQVAEFYRDSQDDREFLDVFLNGTREHLRFLSDLSDIIGVIDTSVVTAEIAKPIDQINFSILVVEFGGWNHQLAVRHDELVRLMAASDQQMLEYAPEIVALELTQEICH